MIKVKHTGNFKKTEKFLNSAKTLRFEKVLEKYGKIGEELLAAATPIDTGKTSESWYYSLEKSSFGFILAWHNSNTPNNVVVALIIQYGHGTGSGGYVAPFDYINPSMRPLFEKLNEALWLEVTKL